MSARTTCLVLGSIGAMALAAPALSQVATDGTVGARLKLDGPEYAIRAGLGRVEGGNLFHSFERFSLKQGERATFSGPDRIENVISRVTGGARSDIDGTIRSTIPNADFYFLNPAGVVFGPNATLDVQGSFHVSTADELRFRDGATFSARDPSASSFTTAPPQAFGFLGAKPAPVAVDASALSLPDGQTLTLAGGRVDVRGEPDQITVTEDGAVSFGRYLFVPGGIIQLAALDQGGSFRPTDGAAKAATGAIVLADAAFVQTDGEGGGLVRIRGGTLSVDDSFIFARLTGDRPGAGIDVQVIRQLEFADSLLSTFSGGSGAAGPITIKADGAILDGSQIDASTGGAGPSGRVELKLGGNLLILGIPEGPLFGRDPPPRAGVYANGRFAGGGGTIEITAPEVRMQDGSIIDAGTFGTERGGKISLKADRLELEQGARVFAGTQGPGDAGEVEIHAKGRVRAGGRDLTRGDAALDRSGVYVTSGQFSFFSTPGNAGRILISADELIVEEGARIRADSVKEQGGASGAIRIDANRVELRTGGQISVSTNAVAGDPGGDLSIRARDALIIVWNPESAPDDFRSGLFNDTGGSAPAGDILIQTRALTLDGGRITTDATASGPAGVVAVRGISGDKVALAIQNEGQIFAGTNAAGEAAAITIHDASEIRIVGTGDADSASPDDNPQPTGIFTNAKLAATGRGGNISLRGERLVMSEGGAISAQTAGTGTAGSVDLAFADQVSIVNSVVETQVSSSARTEGGQIAIISGRLVDLHRSRVTTDGVIPAPGASILLIAAPTIAVNRSTVTSLTTDGKPVPRVESGVVRVLGELALVSVDSLIAGTSTVEIAGLESELDQRLVALPVTFVDANALLRERCAARRDIGASSFTAAGRGGLPASPDAPLLSGYTGSVERRAEAQTSAGQAAGGNGSDPAPAASATAVTSAGSLEPVLIALMPCRGTP